jgi:hypothetical protein
MEQGSQPDPAVVVAGVMAIQALKPSYADKIAIAEALGLEMACCSYCGCFIGAPYCHDSSDVRYSEYDDACPCPQLEAEAKQDAGEED